MMNTGVYYGQTVFGWRWYYSGSRPDMACAYEYCQLVTFALRH